ncbi:DNA methylase, N-6 adenine-specific, conserved site [Penicillium camemberti]|uniref:DNA methylase, N-6 adenine-specific, conserved site n=1 Tax=Penicillium camemberti (strain FM 013) TaxID=1429867 RepID=A0A0G4PEB9_PENC3|nr:DNA methylase, N-6 adenine-specific, conserved site [Penicillium camemberti]
MDLYEATAAGEKDEVLLLFKKGGDVNAEGGEYENSLQAAVSEGYPKIGKPLLKKRANINAQRGEYEEALQAVASEGNPKTVKLLLELLLEQGADVNGPAGEYEDTLQAAVSKGNLKIVKLLLDKGADVNSQGGKYGNALQAAVSIGDPKIVELLLEKGADVNAQGGKYGNALQAAASKGYPNFVKLFLEKGADVNAQGGRYGNTLQAAAAAWQQRPEIVKLLLEKGADVNAQGGECGNALQAAALRGNPEIVKLLLEKGADINSRDGSEGQTPLHLAVEAGSISAVAQLLEQGALTNIRDFSDLNPLELAAQKGDYRIALLLLLRSTDSHTFVKASTWRKLLPGSPSHLEMTIGNTTTIRKTSERDITNRGYPLSLRVKEFAARADDFIGTNVGSRRILVEQRSPADLLSGQRTREADPVWRVQSSKAPSRATLTQVPKKDCFVECRFTTRAIALPIPINYNWPRLSDTSELDIQGFEKTYGILWIMTKRQNITPSESPLESKIFFSTSEYAQVPPHATDLFAPLVQQLLQEWDRTFQVAEIRLAIKRTELLRANGRNPRLIRDLLGDAQLWDLLRRSCNKQIAELMEFRNKYESQSLAVLRDNESTGSEELNKAMLIFQNQINRLEEVYSEGLKALMETSKDLIQLEFNLTSISEAQKSSSTNKSMKRLSWITSLFGMNIDILASNPPWWFYILFAVATTFLTLAVWLIFKHNSHLEDSIERRFNRLTRRQPRQDLETGQRRGLSPQGRSAMFSTLGKKRS